MQARDRIGMLVILWAISIAPEDMYAAKRLQ